MTSSCDHTGCTSTSLCTVSTHRPAARALYQPRRTSRCLSSPGGLSSTTSPTPHVRAPQLLARLVIDYFAYVVQSGASALHAARHRLLHLRHASHTGLNSTTSPTSCVSHWLDLDYASSDCTGSTAPMPCIRTRRLRRSTSPRTTCQGLLICVCFSMDFFSRELHSADYSWDIDQVTTSLLHQLGGYPKEATSKVCSTRQLKVDSGRTFARSSGILRV
jgi:hypothetical protein